MEAEVETTTEYSQNKQAGTREWQLRMRHRARALATQVERGYMELGEILYRIYDAPVDGDPEKGSILHKWGYRSVGEFAEKELGLHLHKAQALARIFYRVAVELNNFGDEELKSQFISLGWSKAKELVRILTKENATYWITSAKDWNVATTREAVKREKERQQAAMIKTDLAQRPDPVAVSNDLSGQSLARAEDQEPVKWVNKLFIVDTSQAETINLALKRAQDLAGNIKKSNSFLLSLICLDFLSGADWQGNSLESKLRFISKIEQSIGLRLVVVDDADEVVYGLRALESAARHMQEVAAEVSDGEV